MKIRVELIQVLQLQVGEVSVTDPLGPDSYGYYIYDEGDLEYEFAPTYDWIEIDPDLGGDGGIVAIDNKGNIAMEFNTAGMYRAHMNANGELNIGIYKE